MSKWYKNLRIDVKITCGFLIVALIAGIIGGIGIIGMKGVESNYRAAYLNIASSLEALEKISTANQRIRANLYKLLVAEAPGDKQDIRNELDKIDAVEQEGLAEYQVVLQQYDDAEAGEDKALLQTLENAANAYHNKRDELVNGLAMNAERRAEAYAFLNNEVAPYRVKVDDAVQALVDYNNAYADEEVARNDQRVRNDTLMLVVWMAVGVALAIFIGLFVARHISRRLKVVVTAINKLAAGDFDVNIDGAAKDEIGVLAKSAHDMSDTLKAVITDVTRGFQAFASGNFAVDTQIEDKYVGSFGPLVIYHRQMRDSLSDTMRNINIAAEQVATGSDQVSSGAQALASGSTEQAAAVQELSATVEQVAEQAAGNLATIDVAAEYIEQAVAGVTTSNDHMQQLSEAMSEISSASSQIASITKVIEDIAFQTNILALNAAIEAARAGSAGKGFAVVADEVRNLAAKSAEAAKQTAELIASAVSTVDRGTQITAQTAQALQDTGVNAGKVSDSFAQIEQASSLQTGAIEQIKEGLSQISAVVQTNAATAEENSATSEEMSAQAVTLRSEVGKFKLWEGVRVAEELPDERVTTAQDADKKAFSSGLALGKY